MTEHTPGPWTVTEASWNENGDVQYTLDGIKETCAADARLIAAAPDLLEALETLIFHFNAMLLSKKSDREVVEWMDGFLDREGFAPIRKARGETVSA